MQLVTWGLPVKMRNNYNEVNFSDILVISLKLLNRHHVALEKPSRFSVSSLSLKFTAWTVRWQIQNLGQIFSCFFSSLKLWYLAITPTDVKAPPMCVEVSRELASWSERFIEIGCVVISFQPREQVEVAKITFCVMLSFWCF